MWKRPLLHLGGTRAFLATLACEGGLPLQMIRSSNANLRRFFHALLRDIEIYADTSLTPEQLAAEHADYLPQSFRHDHIFILAGALASVVRNLQTTVAGQEGDPIAILDDRDPTWRDQLPILLEDELTRELLRNLVADAAEVKRAPNVHLRIRRYMAKEHDCWHLCATLDLPGSLREQNLTQIFPRQLEALSARIEVGMSSESGRLESVAWLSRQPSDHTYLVERFHHHHAIFNEAEAWGAIDLVVRTGDDVLRAAIPNSTALGELPWVFLPLHGTGDLTFVAEGSVNTRCHEAWVVLPPEAQLQPSAGATMQQDSIVKGCDRMLYRLTGEVIISDGDGGLTRIRTREHIDEVHTYRLLGLAKPIGVTLMPIYHGWPKLLEGTTPIPSSQLEWRPKGPGPNRWRPWTERVFGTGHLHYK